MKEITRINDKVIGEIGVCLFKKGTVLAGINLVHSKIVKR